MLHVDSENVREAVTLHCRGRIVRGQETKLLCAVIRRREKEITLNLRDVSEIDAAGIGALVSLQAAGIYVKLANPTATVRQVLRITKLDSVFEITDAQAPTGFSARIEEETAVAS